MTNLLVKPIPFKDESPGSLILRMSELNGWKKTTSFLSAHDALNSYDKIESLMIVKESWLKFCSVSGLKCKRSNDMFYGDVGVTRRRFVGYAGMKVHWNDLPLKHPKVCPDCIKQYHYLPKLWDHKLIYMCSKHNSKLIDICESCKQQLKWNRMGLLKCVCGEEIKTKEINHLDPKPVLYIEKLIKNKDETSLNLLCGLYDAYEYFFKFIEQKYDYSDLVIHSIESINNPNGMLDLVSKHVESMSKLYAIHPRISLVSFISSKMPKINDFGMFILKNINYTNLTNGDDFIFEQHIIDMNQVTKALGITEHLSSFLIGHGVLDAFRNTTRSKWYIKLRSVNKLLNHFSGLDAGNKNNDFKILKKVISDPSQKLDFITAIKECIQGKRKFMKMDINVGLNSIRIGYESTKERESKYYKIKDVAKICDVNYENIRFAIKVGILKRLDSNLSKGVTIFIKKLDALEFNEKYVFGGSIAKKIGLNHTNFSEKIKFFGINPISGPGIDGGLTYLFKRKDISQIDFNKLKGMKYYPTETGRKNKTKNQGILEFKTISATSGLLGISTQKVMALVKSGHLHRVFNMRRAGRITVDSIRQMLNIKNNKSLITIFNAAEQIKETEQSFYWKWVESGFIDYINNGLEKYISKRDLNKIIKFKSKCISSVEASEIAGHHRSYLPNLEKQGLIKHKKVLENSKYSIKFYERDEVEKLIF